MITGILKLAAGIGLFIFAMNLMEESLKTLSGRKFKIFLQKATRSNLGGLAAGALVTALLQSSSMVSLMVLASLGAGVFTMKNAMSIVLGANLGTTVTGWLFSTLGFKMEIEVIAYPAVCLGALFMSQLFHGRLLKYFSSFLFSFGLLFIGLSFIKTSMEATVAGMDFSRLQGMPLIFFLLGGFAITLLVQSSSVTMVLALSAIHAGMIGFLPAAALLLGAETGTTIKLFLGSIGGHSSKKRVALGNFLINFSSTVLAFIWIERIQTLIMDILGIRDPLLALPAFNTAVNLATIFIFLPFLKPFVRLLSKFFKDDDAQASAFIGNANIREPETALDLFRRETEFFIHNSMLFSLELFHITNSKIQNHPVFKKINLKKKYLNATEEEKYEYLKHHQGEMQSFYLLLRTKLQNSGSVQLNQLISSVRSAMHSAKSIKDIGSNISNLRRSSKDIKFDFFVHLRDETEKLYLKLNTFMTREEEVSFEKLQELYHFIQDNYSSALNTFYRRALHAPIEDIDITTAINLNRELFTSNKAMLIAVKDYLLDEKQAGDFNEIPVYRT